MTTVATIPLSAIRSTVPHRRPERAEGWRVTDVEALYDLPFLDLLYAAQQVHREHCAPNEVQLSTLLSIKTGGCPEDCAYCPQSASFDTGVEASKLMPLADVVQAAQAAKAPGRHALLHGCGPGAAPKARDIERVSEMVREVRALGLETCMTLGMLDAPQALALKDAGLDYYNHNLDSDPGYYGSIISTRTYQDRLDTLSHVRESGIKVCLRRHRRPGRDPRTAGRPDRAAGQPRSVPRVRADQQPRPGAGHAAGRHGAAGPVRVRAHDRRRAHHDAARDGAPVGRARADGPKPCRPCVSPPVRTRSSTATGC